MQVTYAAVAANISGGRAFVIKPMLRAKAGVKIAINPSFTALLVAKYRLRIEQIKRTAAEMILMIATALEMDFSLNRPIR